MFFRLQGSDVWGSLTIDAGKQNRSIVDRIEGQARLSDLAHEGPTTQ